MSDFAISTHGLSKRYGDVLAVDLLDLRVGRGEIYAFLGLNGAGKSTTIRMLLGMIKPSAGHAEILGQRIEARTSGLWRKVGHLVESPTAYPELSVRENLAIAFHLQGLKARKRIDEIIEELSLQPYAHRQAKNLSMGNLQRLGLARALLHEPELLLLDEPANALDPAGVVEIRSMLKNLARDRGVTVFLSSHILAEVDRLATRVGIVHQGRLIEELEAEELERKRDRRLEVTARDLDKAEEALRSAGYLPQRTEGVLELREERALESPDEVARLLVTTGEAPMRLAVTQEDLEQHFLRLTRQEGGGK
ncbi:MAG TPA: bacitracin ABC transporter ATP-binding protein [Cyanobacteria bacterium UBA8530]|nr:bacitracin ABC transporter ATP-binding protein [Cyanobacteria bacterium UBA8530]